ncbi:MAG TPA: twin-arginine translocation signal domain-containing protein [Gemmatimonadaceae bacterium]|nr:twin-arginine translocation signal domain-containing protein [Gemmatimonadaceae bacterium]
MSDTKIPPATADLLYSIASRRSFLRSAAATAIAGGALAFPAKTEGKGNRGMFGMVTALVVE